MVAECPVRCAAALAATLLATVLVVLFFLPWLDGASGMHLARGTVAGGTHPWVWIGLLCPALMVFAGMMGLADRATFRASGAAVGACGLVGLGVAVAVVTGDGQPGAALWATAALSAVATGAGAVNVFLPGERQAPDLPEAAPTGPPSDAPPDVLDTVPSEAIDGETPDSDGADDVNEL